MQLPPFNKKKLINSREVCGLHVVASFMNLKIREDSWPFWIPLTFQMQFWRWRCSLRETWPPLLGGLRSRYSSYASKKMILNEVSIYRNMPKEVNRSWDRESDGEAWVKKGGQEKPSQWLTVAGSDGWAAREKRAGRRNLLSCSQRSREGDHSDAERREGSGWGSSGHWRGVRTPAPSHQRLCPVHRSCGSTLVD